MHQLQKSRRAFPCHSVLVREVGSKKDPLPSLPLDVIARTRIVPQTDGPGEPIKTVPNGDVERLAEDAISVLRVGDDLGVSSRNVEDDRVGRGGDVAGDLDVCEGRMKGREER
jgi:hypothetical protein